MAVQVRLENGSIVDLPKDCTCMNHDGPHWLAMDHFWANQNKANRDKAIENARDLMTVNL